MGITLAATLLLLAVDPPAAGPPAGADAVATLVLLRSCEVQYDREAVIGAATPGILQECHVRPGDKVKAGQVLGRLLDDDVRAEAALRKAESQSDIAVRLARAKLAQSRARLRRSRELHRQNFLSADDLDQHQLEAESAALAVEESEFRLEIAKLQSQQAAAAVRVREFVAPHDGVVVGVLKTRGESVTHNDPVFRVVDPSRLRVIGRVDVADAWRIAPDQPVRIAPDIPGAELEVEGESFEGRLVFVDTHIDPETQTCKVIAEVENLGSRLRAGVPVRMEILPRDPEPKPAPEAPRRAPGAGN